MKKLLFLILTISSSSVFAQDLNNLYSYSLGWSNINNAYVGTQGGFDILFMSRSQFNGVPGSPTNNVAIGSFAISDVQSIGAKIISDSRGVFDITRFEGIYAQQFQLNTEGSFLRFGMSFGVTNSSIDLSGVNNNEEVLATGDPVLTSSGYNYTHFTSGAGVLLFHQNVELGVSTPHLVESDKGIQPLILSSAAYNYQIASANIGLKPAVIYQSRPDDKNIFDGFLTVTWKDLLSGIAGYSSDDRLRFGGRIKVSDFSVGYINESPFGSNARTNTTHEISVRVTLKSSKKKEVSALNSQINQLLAETKELATGSYDKDYLRSRLIEIERELDDLIEKNSVANSSEIAVKLQELEGQILQIFDKLNR
ncbi:PorP/SprF family type IX secretion system membrane protein [Marinoscillum pacificum]|uniref:PorP/SprF family type IX secretion system membrane protein n=1 Tax=Marinoscillum pacificum TaxID=392723 RepID=UPI0021586E17|nr:PorP/SprF family type IX secretion system membrane protein [Marinoscillum pacificum]